MKLSLALLAALALSACVHHAKQPATARMAFDLNCPENQLQVFELDRLTRGVRGCGRQATYVRTCDGPEHEALTTCQWILNGPVTTTVTEVTRPSDAPGSAPAPR